MSDALTRLLRALSQAPLPPGADACTLADAVWLAASGAVGEGTLPAPAAPADETAPGPESDVPARPDGDAPEDAETTSAPGAENAELSLRRSGSGTTVRGAPLSLGRADPLPDALAVGRAIQPFRRPWRQGGRSRLDVEATVEHYARGGPLVPLFRPAPEPWFEAVVLVDSSLSMSVWEETTRTVIRLLTTLGGFRAVHTWRLEWQGTEPRVRDHRGREVPGERVPHHGSGTQGRRLVMVVSDCAARGWHAPAPWLLLRDWGGRIPVALLDPLPPRLWRRSALNLPAVRVTGSRAGDHNSALRFTPPPRLRTRAGEDQTAGPWTALPVMSCTPRSLGAWASTLMRADPAGCGAVLVPATGRLPRARGGTAPARKPDPAGLAEAFVHTAPAPAVRLAVLCSGLRELPLPLLHVLRDQAVPEAGYSDLAEVLTSGLFAVRRDPGGDPVLALHSAAREYLRTYLTTHDEWQTRAAFSRHAAAHPYAPQGIAAVLHGMGSATGFPAAERSFAETVTAPRRAVGGGRTSLRSGGSQRRAGTARPVARGGDAGTAGPADEASAVARRVWEETRTLMGPAADSALQDAETLLRHLIDYTYSRLPAPLGGWPGPDTCFDDLRAAKGPLTPADLLDDLRGFPSVEGVALEGPPQDDTTGRDLVWHASGGPLHVTVAMHTAFSWSRATAAVSTALAAGAAVPSPVEFMVFLDEVDKPGGLESLDRCVMLVERKAPRQSVAVLLRLQTRYGRAPLDSRAALADTLRALHSRAGGPTHSKMIQQAAQESPPVSLRAGTLYEWFTGRSVPADEQAFGWLTRHLARRAGLEGDGDWSPFRLAALRHHAEGEEHRQGGGSSVRRERLGRPIAELVEEAERMELPPYVERSYDPLLRDVVRDCAAGASGMVLIIGPAGSGKSRSSVEAARLLPHDWWLWEPDSSAELAAALDAPASIGPRTVMWLDNAERYLLDQSDGGRGERIAAGLRTRLREADGGPVLVLGSLRTDYWNVLTTVPAAAGADPHPQARALCEENLILHGLPTIGTDEIERYVSGPAAARAVVDAAIDARRCGHGPVVSGALLAEAVLDYLDSQTPPPVPGDFSAGILAGMGLSRVRPSAGEAESSPAYYRLSDDIERYGGESRHRPAPPESLWDALAKHASAPDLEAIARTARERGDTRRAERFRALADSARRLREASAAHEKAAPALRKLLQRTDLTGAEARAAADQALAWLRADEGTESAQYVLNGLLPRTGLSPEQTAEAVQHALDWLHVHGDTQDAAFVLAPLLAVTGLHENEARQVVAHAVEWLDVRGERESAQFVLRPVLRRHDLSDEQAHVVADRALNWLDLHRGRLSNQFVLSAALRRRDLAPEPRTRFVTLGIDWLQEVGTDSSAKFVLRPLLQRTDLTPGEAGVAVALAMDWLRAHGTTREAQFVFNALLYSRGLGTEEVREAGQMALDWLRAHGSDRSARYVLRPLLERTDLGPELSARAVEAGTQWSRARIDGGESDGGVQRLLNRRAAAPGSVRSCVVLIAEIANFADAGAADQTGRQRALHDVLAQVLGNVSDVPSEGRHTGDGEAIVFFPDETRRTTLVRDLLRHLEGTLHDHAVTGTLRLRVALHGGEVGRDERAWHVQAMVTANRLVGSPALRAALEAGSRSPVAVVVSDELFGTAFPERNDLAGLFRPVYVRTKESVEKAWISVAGYGEPPGVEAWTRSPAAGP